MKGKWEWRLSLQFQHNTVWAGCCWAHSCFPEFCWVHSSPRSRAAVGDALVCRYHFSTVRRKFERPLCVLVGFHSCCCSGEWKLLWASSALPSWEELTIKPNSALTLSTWVDSKSSVRLLAMTKPSNYSLPVLCFLHSFLIHHCIDFWNCVL